MFADTETTGTEPEDRLIQLAFRCGVMDWNGLYNPGVPINLVAMATHHITEEQVAGQEKFKKSRAWKLLKKQGKNLIFIAHNAAFDLSMLEREGIEMPHHICTLKVIRHLDEDCEFECYTQQYLRYKFGLKFKEEITPHDAWSDILVLEMIFTTLMAMWRKKFNHTRDEALTGMMEISQKPSFIRVFQFGKYKGRKTTEIAEEDPGYLQWLQREKIKEPEGEEDWLYTLEILLGQ